MRILVIDDDYVSRRLLEAVLTREGYNVVFAENGQVAWELLQNDFIPLIITDWLMPVLDGPSLIRLIRAGDLPGYTYIMLLTTLDSQEDIIRGLESGADDFLKKPFHDGELLARLKIGQRILHLETHLRDVRDQLQYQATHDSLTRLLNRPAIVERAALELERSKRSQQPLSLVLIDIDYFKRINDTYGHLVGDQALRLVSEAITTVMRPYDGIGRWGGEEILILLPDTVLEAAVRVAERVRERVATTALPLEGGESFFVTISLGVSSTTLFHNQDAELDMLFQQADQALYAAKRAGRNCVYRAAALAHPTD